MPPPGICAEYGYMLLIPENAAIFAEYATAMQRRTFTSGDYASFFPEKGKEMLQKEMEGIYTTCVLPDTLDESPMAYKSMDEIVAQIGPTAEIIERIRPVYNFKAAD